MEAVTNINEKREGNECLANNTIPEKFVVNLQGKTFVKYDGLLELAHKKGLKSLKTELIQMPNEANNYVALMKATLVGNDGSEFEDYGDASHKSVQSSLIPHIIRMASTRAKARTLRDFTNVGMTSIDEIGDEDIVTFQEAKAEPLTERQKDALRKQFVKVAHILESVEEIEKLSKDEATKLIGEYIFNKSSKDAPNQKKVQDTPTKAEGSNNQSSNTSQEEKKVEQVNNSEERATKSQVGYAGILVKQVAAKQGKKVEEVEDKIKKEFKVENLEDISRGVIAKLIDKLKEQLTVQG